LREARGLGKFRGIRVPRHCPHRALEIRRPRSAPWIDASAIAESSQTTRCTWRIWIIVGSAALLPYGNSGACNGARCHRTLLLLAAGTVSMP
jgi:hypothetical protein